MEHENKQQAGGGLRKFNALVSRLFCLHSNWTKAVMPKKYPAWFETEWQCTRCGKRIVLNNRNPPIQYIGTNVKHERPRGRKGES